MKCQVCKTDKILMRTHEVENHLPLYHTSIVYEGRTTKEVDIIFCGAKCSLDYYEHTKKGTLNEY